MAHINEVLKGLEILKKYVDEGDPCAVGAQHDVIMASVTLEQLPEDSEDGKALMALGWGYDDDADCWCRFT